MVTTMDDLDYADDDLALDLVLGTDAEETGAEVEAARAFLRDSAPEPADRPKPPVDLSVTTTLPDSLEHSWQTKANCMGVDPELFFPERGSSTLEAKEVCRGCVVREDCLEYAIANGEKFGIWGGLSERERRRLRRQRSIERQRRAMHGDSVNLSLTTASHPRQRPRQTTYSMPELKRHILAHLKANRGVIVSPSGNVVRDVAEALGLTSKQDRNQLSAAIGLLGRSNQIIRRSNTSRGLTMIRLPGVAEPPLLNSVPRNVPVRLAPPRSVVVQTGDRARTRQAVIRLLAESNGVMADPSGHVCGLLAIRLNLSSKPDKNRLSQILQAMDRESVITRRVSGKLTYEIRLVGFVASGRAEPVRASRNSRQAELRQAVLDLLRTKGGIIAHSTNAAGVIADSLGLTTMRARQDLSHALGTLEDRGFITRQICGRRTTEIRLRQVA